VVTAVAVVDGVAVVGVPVVGVPVAAA
jgi:hypothetical protein